MKKILKVLLYAIGMIALTLYIMVATAGQVEEKEEAYRQEAISNGVYNIDIDE